MGEEKEILENNRLDDLSWLCSLSQSELDFVISLKMLVLQRAKVIGHKELAKRFDLKILRAIAFGLMKEAREQLNEISLKAGSADLATIPEDINLLKSEMDETLSMKELKALICNDSRKRTKKRRRKEFDDEP